MPDWLREILAKYDIANIDSGKFDSRAYNDMNAGIQGETHQEYRAVSGDAVLTADREAGGNALEVTLHKGGISTPVYPSQGGADMSQLLTEASPLGFVSTERARWDEDSGQFTYSAWEAIGTELIQDYRELIEAGFVPAPLADIMAGSDMWENHEFLGQDTSGKWETFHLSGEEIAENFSGKRLIADGGVAHPADGFRDVEVRVLDNPVEGHRHASVTAADAEGNGHAVPAERLVELVFSADGSRGVESPSAEGNTGGGRAYERAVLIADPRGVCVSPSWQAGQLGGAVKLEGARGSLDEIRLNCLDLVDGPRHADWISTDGDREAAKDRLPDSTDAKYNECRGEWLLGFLGGWNDRIDQGKLDKSIGNIKSIAADYGRTACMIEVCHDRINAETCAMAMDLDDTALKVWRNDDATDEQKAALWEKGTEFIRFTADNDMEQIESDFKHVNEQYAAFDTLLGDITVEYPESITGEYGGPAEQKAVIGDNEREASRLLSAAIASGTNEERAGIAGGFRPEVEIRPGADGGECLEAADYYNGILDRVYELASSAIPDLGIQRMESGMLGGIDPIMQRNGHIWTDREANVPDIHYLYSPGTDHRAETGEPSFVEFDRHGNAVNTERDYAGIKEGPGGSPFAEAMRIVCTAERGSGESARQETFPLGAEWKHWFYSGLGDFADALDMHGAWQELRGAILEAGDAASADRAEEIAGIARNAYESRIAQEEEKVSAKDADAESLPDKPDMEGPDMEGPDFGTPDTAEIHGTIEDRPDAARDSVKGRDPSHAVIDTDTRISISREALDDIDARHRGDEAGARQEKDALWEKLGKIELDARHFKGIMDECSGKMDMRGLYSRMSYQMARIELDSCVRQAVGLGAAVGEGKFITQNATRLGIYMDAKALSNTDLGKDHVQDLLCKNILPKFRDVFVREDGTETGSYSKYGAFKSVLEKVMAPLTYANAMLELALDRLLGKIDMNPDAYVSRDSAPQDAGTDGGTDRPDAEGNDGTPAGAGTDGTTGNVAQADDGTERQDAAADAALQPGQGIARTEKEEKNADTKAAAVISEEQRTSGAVPDDAEEAVPEVTVRDGEDEARQENGAAGDETATDMATAEAEDSMDDALKAETETPQETDGGDSAATGEEQESPDAGTDGTAGNGASGDETATDMATTEAEDSMDDAPQAETETPQETDGGVSAAPAEEQESPDAGTEGTAGNGAQADDGINKGEGEPTSVEYESGGDTFIIDPQDGTDSNEGAADRESLDNGLEEAAESSAGDLGEDLDLQARIESLAGGDIEKAEGFIDTYGGLNNLEGLSDDDLSELFDTYEEQFGDTDNGTEVQRTQDTEAVDPGASVDEEAMRAADEARDQDAGLSKADFPADSEQTWDDVSGSGADYGGED